MDGGIGGSDGDIGGGGRNKGKNIPNQAKLDAQVRREQAKKRQRENEMAYELPPADYGGGSQILKHLVLAYPDLLRRIYNQTREDCWAVSLSEILQFHLNKDRPTNQHTALDVESFIRNVKLSDDELLKARKNLSQLDLAVGSMKKALDYLFEPGLEKNDGRKGSKSFTVKSKFCSRDNASPNLVAELLEKGCLVGIIVAIDESFRELKDGILMLGKGTTRNGGSQTCSSRGCIWEA